jgi:hypothetical protein
MIVFWDVEPCSVLELNRRFRGACCLQDQRVEFSDGLGNGGSKHL